MPLKADSAVGRAIPPIHMGRIGGNRSRFGCDARGGLRYAACLSTTVSKNGRTDEQPDRLCRERAVMHDMLQPLIHKAAVRDIVVHVARTGLSIGDEAELHTLPDGRVGVFARLTRRFLGLIPRQVTLLIGVLGPHASALIAPAVERGELLRVRIVGLTPEHLTSPGMGPEVHVSVWGDPRHIAVWSNDGTVSTPPPLKSEGPAL